MKKNLSLVFLLLFIQFFVDSNRLQAQTETTDRVEKIAYIPAEIYRVPEKNNYADEQSEFSDFRRLESENIVIFWAKEYGADPTKHENKLKRFDPKAMLKECERFYSFYRDSIKMVQRGKSLSDKYKLLFYVIGGDEGTAFGGGAADSVGVMWASSLRIQNKPFGAVAHEMGHCFQYLAKCDGNWAFSSPVEGSKGHSIFEMTAQYMLWQVYPEWLTFENYHLKSFLEKTHYAFLHETNMYHSPHMLEYWASIRGVDFVGRIWREAVAGEDPVRTYKRLCALDQDAFNDELFDAYRRFITWDIPRIVTVASVYANQHHTELEEVGDGWHRIAAHNTPQNYGYNGIKLDSFRSGKAVELDFRGIAGTEGYRKIDLTNAGWRYGFVAQQLDGSRVYSPIFSAVKGKCKFTVPKNTQQLWLVVCGAPKEHKVHVVDGKEENDEQWPYMFKLNGARINK
ncbi:DUF6055 domain-containing protein [Sphingobacterium siyangense]|uniref:DUF6055 domain-containing protein n=1 Tax=Sphingobacterium siyangense TaxID=459529 RepID=UPI003C731F9E